MKKVNQFCLILSVAFFFALLVTPLSAQNQRDGGRGLLPGRGGPAKVPAPTTAPTLAKVKEELAAVIVRYENALNAENSTAIAPLVDANLTFLEADGSTKKVSEADFIASLDEAFKAPGKETVNLYGTQVQILSTNGAILLGSYTVVVVDEKGEMTDMVRSGQFIYQFRKSTEGWVIEQMTDFPNK